MIKKAACILFLILFVSIFIFVEADSVKIEKFVFANDTLELAAGFSATPSYRLIPENANEQITWKSSDPTIATVDENGLITGQKKGKCKVTVFSENGKRQKAQINVKVEEYDLVFTNTFSQSAKFYFKNGSFKVTWNSKNGCVEATNIATEVAALTIGTPSWPFDVVPLKPGKDLLTVKAGNVKTEIRILVTEDAFSKETTSQLNYSKSMSATRKADRRLMTAEEILSEGETIIDWHIYNVAVLATRAIKSEGSGNREELRIGCFIDEEPAWGYIESIQTDNASAMLNAFMAGSEEVPFVCVYDRDYGLLYLDLMTGVEQWALKSASPVFDASVHTCGPVTGILYLPSYDNKAIISVSAEGKTFWTADLHLTENDKITEIKLGTDNIEVCFESGRMIPVAYNGKVIE